MKYLLLSIALIFAFGVFGSFNQKNQLDVWQELEIFHQAIAFTFHPAEDGDFEPVKNDSKELVEAVQKLLTSKLPVYFEKMENEELKNELQTSLQKLFKQCTDLHNLVQTQKTTDQEFLDTLNDVHSTYHHIEELNNKAKNKSKE